MGKKTSSIYAEKLFVKNLAVKIFICLKSFFFICLHFIILIKGSGSRFSVFANVIKVCSALKYNTDLSKHFTSRPQKWLLYTVSTEKWNWVRVRFKVWGWMVLEECSSHPCWEDVHKCVLHEGHIPAKADSNCSFKSDFDGPSSDLWVPIAVL